MKNKMSLEEIEDLTYHILFNYDMLVPPVDVIDIAEKNGIDVYEADLSDYEEPISGAIKYDKKTKKFEILINKNDNIQQKRFTIAHELGHYYLHKSILENDEIHVDTMFSGNSKKFNEKDADYFAGALLMNKIALSKFYEKVDTMTELANIFEVSRSALLVRLDELGIISGR